MHDEFLCQRRRWLQTFLHLQIRFGYDQSRSKWAQWGVQNSYEVAYSISFVIPELCGTVEVESATFLGGKDKVDIVGASEGFACLFKFYGDIGKDVRLVEEMSEVAGGVEGGLEVMWFVWV